MKFQRYDSEQLWQLEVGALQGERRTLFVKAKSEPKARRLAPIQGHEYIFSVQLAAAVDVETKVLSAVNAGACLVASVCLRLDLQPTQALSVLNRLYERGAIRKAYHGDPLFGGYYTFEPKEVQP